MGFHEQKIRFTIKPNGIVTQDVTGVSGPACTALTESIEEALGKVSKRELKEEAKEIKEAEKVKIGY